MGTHCIFIQSCFQWKQVTPHGLWPDGNPALEKLVMAQSSIPGGTSCLGTQAEEGRNPQADRDHLWGSIPRSLGPEPWKWPSAWEDGSAGATGSCGRQQQSLCGTLSPPPPPAWGGIQRCIVLPSPPPRTQSSDCVASWGWGEKRNRHINVNFSVLSFSS